MNPVALRLAVAWVFVSGAMAAIDLFVFPALGLFPWFPFSGVLWFAGFLAVVLGVVYVVGSMMGYTDGGSGGSPGRQSRQSKGARDR